MTVPKTAMNENDGPMPGQHYVWLPGKRLDVQAEAEPKPMKERSFAAGKPAGSANLGKPALIAACSAAGCGGLLTGESADMLRLDCVLGSTTLLLPPLLLAWG